MRVKIEEMGAEAREREEKARVEIEEAALQMSVMEQNMEIMRGQMGGVRNSEDEKARMREQI